MFAVPGWSVPADKLKHQVEESPKENKKKRKRGSRKEDDREVDANNVAELWQQHFEKKGTGSKKSKNKDSKRVKQGLKYEKDAPNRELQDQNGGNEEAATISNEERSTTQSKSKRGDEEDVEMQHNHQPNKHKSIPSTTNMPPTALSPEPPQLPPTSTLTPLQVQMRQKLIGSRFRYLNETLYTTPSSSSQTLFSENPSFFTEYHEGFRRQVSTWPENPVDGFVEWILERGKIRPSKKNSREDPKHRYRKARKPPPSDKSTTSTTDPLPRNASQRDWSTIVDLGCGDAKLAQALQNSNPNQLKLSVKSFDLAAPNDHVSVADIRSLPLQDGSVDVAIFCLALMGTNWIEFVEEAYRILRWKGECWVAEVASRFGVPRGKKGKRVEHSVGNKFKEKDGRKPVGKGKGKKEAEEEEVTAGPEEQGMVEDVTARPVATTDVSAFVEVLRRRGFVLQGEPEMGNKMFVRMRFVKAAPAARGKCAKRKEHVLQQMPKFIDVDDEAGQITVEEEARVLKPCVYKTR